MHPQVIDDQQGHGGQLFHVLFAFSVEGRFGDFPRVWREMRCPSLVAWDARRLEPSIFDTPSAFN